MSATMFGGASPTARRGLICGVCARIAERAAVPAWLPRVGFVVFSLAYCWLAALIAYGVLAWIMSPRRRGRDAAFAPSTPPPYGPSFGYDAAREKFRHLDERLAHLEAATVRSEANLRRAFRDLERK